MISGKELINKAVKLEKVSRIPWVPFVGCHGANLIGVNADEYLRSSHLIVEGVSKAIGLYKPDGIPIIFDLQVEAEILGCELAWSEQNPPAVISHPLLSRVKTLQDLTIPNIHDGRIPVILDASRELRYKFPDIALYGLITSPFTLALHLLGTDIFLKMFEDSGYVDSVLNFCTEVCISMSDYYINEGIDVIALVDPMTSQIDSTSFESFLVEPMTKIFEHIRSRGKLSSFFVCGNAQQNIEIMCKCKPDNISIDENIPLDYVKEIALSNKISFGGNLKLTSILLMGDEFDSQHHAVETMDLGGYSGFILAPGCDLPMSTPKDNLIAVSQMVHNEYQRNIIRNLEHKSKSIELLDLTDHWKTGKVIIDVITLDSASCTPCQYMVEAVENASKSFGDIVEINEYKIKEEKGIQMMMSLGVQNLPTICMNGDIEFISQIPPQSDLIKTIEKHLKN